MVVEQATPTVSEEWRGPRERRRMNKHLSYYAHSVTRYIRAHPGVRGTPAAAPTLNSIHLSRNTQLLLSSLKNITIWSAADNEILEYRQNVRFETKVVHFFLGPFRDLYPPVPRLFCIPMTPRDTTGHSGPGRDEIFTEYRLLRRRILNHGKTGKSCLLRIY